MSGQVKMPPIQDASEEIPTPNGARNRMRSSADFPWQSPVRQQARDAMYRSLSEGLEIIAPASSEREFGPFAGKFTVSEAFFEPLLFISPDKPDLDELERQALQREERLRAVASSVASSLPTDDESWAVLNEIRHRLIEKELDDALTPEDEILLGTLEVLSDRRIKKSGALSLKKADELLRRLEEKKSG